MKPKTKTPKPEPLDFEEVYKKIREWAIKNGQVSYEGATIQITPTPKEITKKTIEEIKQRIKSACEFYLRYKDNSNLLINEHPEYERENIVDCALIEPIEETRAKYNDWLFKLAFKDIFNKDDKLKL